MLYFLRKKDDMMYHDIINCLVSTIEAKDLYTSGHSNRVGDMSFDLAKLIGMKRTQLRNIHIAAHLHDIGKIGIPDSILNKASTLLPHEWEQIKSHSQIGYNILKKSHKLNKISKIVLYHHEKWNGSGYPEGLKEEKIPLGSRIIAVCDSIDAMLTDRPYRKALTIQECREEILANKGIQFDPVIADAAVENFDLLTNFYKNASA